MSIEFFELQREGKIMRKLSMLSAAVLCAVISFTQTRAAELNPAAISIKTLDQMPWGGPPAGSTIKGSTQSVTLVGDPTKPGLYIQIIKWSPNNTSRPHFHPNDRFITVLSGTWWVNTGAKYNLDTMVPVKAGSFVTHFAKEVHYDGAKDEPAVIQIVGMGPATVVPAEEK